MKVLKKSSFSTGYGLITDYISAILHELRGMDCSAILNQYAKFSGTLSERDHNAIRKTFSGFCKLLYPNGVMTDEEAKELIDFAAESRKRVKDQLYLIDTTFRTEPAKFEYIWLKSGETVKVETLENLENHHRSVMEQAESNEGEAPEFSTQDAEKETTDTPPARAPRPRVKELVSKTISIRENQGGVTYQNLFGDYLRNAKEITLIDPFIRQPYQIDNLVDFIQMVREVTTQQDGIKIHLSTQNEDDEKVAEVIDCFNDLADELSSLGIEFTYDFKADHDRLIKTNTGWIITLGRGLDIYEKFGRFSLGRANQQNRRCKAFNVSINKDVQ